MKLLTYYLPQPLLLTVLSMAAIISSNTQAQGDSAAVEQNWYQIEVFIFAYDPNTAQQEAWPQELGLKYPQRIVQLNEAASTDVLVSDQPEQVTETTPELSDQPETAAGSPQPVAELSFTLLDADQLSFQYIIKRLSAQRDMRPLFHGAWRQPIQDRKNAESVLIRGGDKFDNHYELEGSISIGLERYLHISTDLWLSSFVSNAGLEKTPWPILPPSPVTSNAAIEVQAQDPFQTNNQAYFFSSQSFNFDNPFLDTTGNLYSVEQTVTMRQQRRMRSQELHYIDHPLMGLLVRITQYERPVEETSDPLVETDSTE